ncbi:hypothetical protein PINS_up013416 [Pythium insidiosum]|nr:hypothetical protein PINS_up013416 [Pythium insidiosum]
MACRKRQHGVARLLMLSGANAELADRGGTTALDVLRAGEERRLLELWAELKGRDTKEAPAPTVALALERQREGEEKKPATEETALKTRQRTAQAMPVRQKTPQPLWSSSGSDKVAVGDDNHGGSDGRGA